MKLPNEPVELRRDSQEDLANDMNHLAMRRVNGASTTGTGGEKKLAVLRRKDKAHRDALFRCGYRQCILQVTTDWHLTLCRGQMDRVVIVIDDASRVLLSVGIRFVIALRISA